jgi:hypothetical protein
MLHQASQDQDIDLTRVSSVRIQDVFDLMDRTEQRIFSQEKLELMEKDHGQGSGRVLGGLALAVGPTLALSLLGIGAAAPLALTAVPVVAGLALMGSQLFTKRLPEARAFYQELGIETSEKLDDKSVIGEINYKKDVLHVEIAEDKAAYLRGEITLASLVEKYTDPQFKIDAGQRINLVTGEVIGPGFSEHSSRFYKRMEAAEQTVRNHTDKLGEIIDIKEEITATARPELRQAALALMDKAYNDRFDPDTFPKGSQRGWEQWLGRLEVMEDRADLLSGRATPAALHEKYSNPDLKTEHAFAKDGSFVYGRGVMSEQEWKKRWETAAQTIEEHTDKKTPAVSASKKSPGRPGL